MKINDFIKFFCSAVVLFSLTSSAEAKTVSLGFNMGDVVAAEFTSALLDSNIVGKEESPVFPAYRNMRYVAVVLKMQNGRTVNQFDYSLTINGIKAECVAIARGMNSFDCTPHNEPADGKCYIRMLYVFDGARVRPGATVAGTLTLRYAATADRLRAVRFNITNIGNKEFTHVDKIPAAGLLK